MAEIGASVTIKVSVRLAWWVRWYLSACALFGRLHKLEPNAEKISNTIKNHGIKVKVEVKNGR